MNRLAVLITAGVATSVGLAVAIGWNHFINKPSAIWALREGAGLIAGGSGDPEEPPSTIVKKPDTPPRKEALPGKPAERKGEALPLVRSPVPPSFDIVRVENDGSAVLAGRAAPAARVDILLDGKVVASVRADESGAWTYVSEKPLFTGMHELALFAQEKGSGLRSEQVLTVSMKPARESGAPLVLLASPDAPTKVLQKPVPTEGEARKTERRGSPARMARTRPLESTTGRPQSPETTSQRTVSAGKKRRPSASEESSASKESKALSATALPRKRKHEEASKRRTLVLNTVDYDEDGRIFFTGQAVAGAALRLYVDNRFLADVSAGETGAWEWRGKASIPPGRHALRIDRLAADGRVLERIELPFVREDVRRVAEARAATGDTTLRRKLGQRVNTASSGPKQPGKPLSGQKNSRKTRAFIEEDRRVQGGLAATVAQVAPRAAPTAETSLDSSEGQAATAHETDAGSGATAGSKVGFIIIQPGNNLWNIARVIYGRGVRYTTIYKANRDQIRDPALIYPGQVFRAPGLPPRKITISPERKTPFSPRELEKAPPAEETAPTAH